MIPGGHSENLKRRAALPQVSATDLLPTASAVLQVKAWAGKICGARAGDCAWPDLDAAKAWVDLIPLVALLALRELCGGVQVGRLARCVGLDPLDGPDAIATLRTSTRWPAVAEAVDMVVRACGGER